MSYFIEISLPADKDLEGIFDYTSENFGLDQAVKYVSSFDSTFELLIANPIMGRERSEIRKNLLSTVNENHIIFYRILTNRIRIVRILHRSLDLQKHFEL